MSTYLFVKVMDLVSDIIHRAMKEGEIKLHHIWTEPMITHLSFVDNLISFFMEMKN